MKVTFSHENENRAEAIESILFVHVKPSTSIIF